MLKRMTPLVVILGLVATSAFGAAIDYRWYDNTGSNLVDNDDNAIAAGDATVLTYISEDGSIDFDGSVPLSSSYGNDVFHRSRENLLSDGKYLTSFVDESPTSHVGSFIYAVILDLPYADFVDLASVPAGTYYGLTSLGDDPAIDGSPNGLTDTEGTNPAQTFVGGDVQTSFQVVPEPGQLLLLLVSLAFCAVGNRRRARAG